MNPQIGQKEGIQVDLIGIFKNKKHEKFTTHRTITQPTCPKCTYKYVKYAKMHKKDQLIIYVMNISSNPKSIIRFLLLL